MSKNVCCPTDVKPVTNDYQGTGSLVTLHEEEGDGAELAVYVAGADAYSGKSTFAICNVYDIFGPSSHTQQLADRLAEACHCVVCVPDLIAHPWDPTNVPPTKNGTFPPGIEPQDGTDVLVNWILHHPDTRLDRTNSLQTVRTYLVETHGSKQMGVVAVCWGAKVAFTVANAAPNLIDAVAACHGSFLAKSDVEHLNVPVCLLNSKDEPESYETELGPILLSKSKNRNFVKTFPTMHHGWMGTRGVGSVTDFDHRPDVVAAYLEGLHDLANFFLGALTPTTTTTTTTTMTTTTTTTP